MSRNDKIGAVVLGALLFAGLFYFIHTTLQNPLPADLGDDTFATDTGDTGDELLPEEGADETPAVSTETATDEPAAAPAAPAAPAPQAPKTKK
jgi:hypothetical protein